LNKVVFDTKILATALLGGCSFSREVLGLVINKQVGICYDDRILSEYKAWLSIHN